LQTSHTSLKCLKLLQEKRPSLLNQKDNFCRFCSISCLYTKRILAHNFKCKII
jgi:hypothetical protein